MLGPGARERIAALRTNGVRTVVLDECHHLASMWGYVVRAALAQLAGVHVVALTATPPDALTAEEHDLYTGLLGPVSLRDPDPGAGTRAGARALPGTGLADPAARGRNGLAGRA